jgi:hypothetical protein
MHLLAIFVYRAEQLRETMCCICGGHSVGIVRLRTKGHGCVVFVYTLGNKRRVRYISNQINHPSRYIVNNV